MQAPCRFEPDEDVDIARLGEVVAPDGPEQRETADAGRSRRCAPEAQRYARDSWRRDDLEALDAAVVHDLHGHAFVGPGSKGSETVPR